MKKIAFVLYREWAYEIYKDVVEYQSERGDFEICALITPYEHDLTEQEALPRHMMRYHVDPKDDEMIEKILDHHKPDLVVYYSWSWIVREPILSKYLCLCLHPSDLPSYRGGTPIQHQIIDGVKASAVSVFKMGPGIDDGPIYRKHPISLEGSIRDVFARMADAGKVITRSLISDMMGHKLKFVDQIEALPKATFALLRDVPKEYWKEVFAKATRKRRKPKDSEIELEKVRSMSFEKLNDLVRALGDPYPNAYISFGSKRLLIKELVAYSLTEAFDGKRILNHDSRYWLYYDDRADFVPQFPEPAEGEQMWLLTSDALVKILKCELKDG